MKIIELPALKDNDKDYEAIEKRIHDLWKTELYIPLMKALGKTSATLQNSKPGLLDAIKDGHIQYYRGRFSGRFNAAISKDLKALGAQWERKTGTWKLPQSSLSIEVRNAISNSISGFQSRIAKADDLLAKILPEELAGKLKISQLFDQTLYKINKDFKQSVRRITVSADLSDEQRERIASEWQDNMRLWIEDWTEKEIVNLRKDVQASVFSGNRNDAVVRIIQKSHDVSINKAKFLARQETRLLLAKFKQTRYEDAGVNDYKWGISARPVQAQGAPYMKGQVRHDHAVLANKIFKWQTPPITNHETGARNNPGQDYNCRCFAIPIVNFKGAVK